MSTGTAAGFASFPTAYSVAALLIGASVLPWRRRPAATIAALAAVAFGMSSWTVAARRVDEGPLATMSLSVPRCDVSGTIVERAGGLGTLAHLHSLSCTGFDASGVSGSVVLNGSTGDAGAPFTAAGWLVPLSKDGFGRARARLGADALLDASDVEVGRVPPGIFALAARIRRSLRRATMPLGAASAGLIGGVAVGDDSRLDAGTQELFRRAGLSHLLVVSGQNVAMVLGAVAVLTRKARRSWRVASSAGGLALFVLVAGPEPSVLRAAAMGAIAVVCLWSGRRIDAVQLLILALVVVIALRPPLVFSGGLHLSAAATLGIILWAPRMARALGRLPQLISIPLGVTIAAQIAVAPLLAGIFGEISLIAPLANLLAVPAVAPATIAGLLAGIAGSFNAPAGELLAHLADPFARWILYIGTRFGQISWASAAVPGWFGWVLGAPVAGAAVLSMRRP